MCWALQDEAFALWTEEWGSLYAQGSRSRTVIEDIANSWRARPCPAPAERARVPCTASYADRVREGTPACAQMVLSDCLCCAECASQSFCGNVCGGTGGAPSACVACCVRGTAAR